MKIKRIALAVTLLASQVITQAQAQIQDYPAKPILFVIPFASGGDSDLSGRNVAHHASKYLNNRPTVSLNKVGASGAIGSMHVKSATPDGYTLLVARIATHAVLPAIESRLGYKWNDFSMISLIELNPFICFVKPESAIRTAADLIATIRKSPGKLNYGTAGPGSLHHISGSLLEQLAETKMIAIAYKGTGPAVTDLAAGNLDIVITTPPGVIPLSQTGKIRILAVTGNQRIPSLPNVPSAAEEGFPNFSVDAWFGFVAPMGTPPEVVKRLADEMAKAVTLDSFKKGVEGAGGTVQFQGTAAFDATIKRDIQMFQRVIKAANISAE